ncbi:MAG: hypothetical protein RLZZ157_1249 [Pseudomonadota bacterium]|jgi:iron complex outermembrane receptor protein
MKALTRAILATTSLAALTSPALAQSTNTTETILVIGQKKPDNPAATNSAATKTDTPILLTPQSVQIVPRAVLNSQKAITLSDAVRNVGGVAQDFGFNGASQPLLVLRGFSATSMTARGSMSGSSSYYLDGTRVTGLPVNMANVEQVEVVKGPATVLYGRSEPGGLVNVVSRPFSQESRFFVEQTLGSFGLSRSVAEGAAALNADKTLLVKGSATYLDSGFDRDFVEDRLTALSAGLAWVPSTRTQVSFTASYSDQLYRTDYGIPAIGDRPGKFPRTLQFNDSPELSQITTSSGMLEARHDFNASWQIKARAVAIAASTHEVDVTPYRVDLVTYEDCIATTGKMCRYYYYARPNGKLDVNQLGVDLLGKFNLGATKHNVLFGHEHYRSNKTGTLYLAQLPATSLTNPMLGNTPALDITTASPDVREDKSLWQSVYVQDQVDLGHGLNLVLALRHDATEAAYAAPGTPANKVSFTTPRVGAVWQFSKVMSTYVQYQEALSANNGRDPVSGNALAPEKSRQTEIGWKYAAVDGRLVATLAAYELVKRNLSDYSLFPIIQTIGEATSRGIELDVIGQVSPALSVMASYAYTEAKVTDATAASGKRLANVPDHAASLWARYALSPAWTVGGGAFYQGARAGDIANSFELPSYTRLDAMLSYDFKLWGSQATAQLNVNNLTDKRYYTGSHQFVQDWIAPGPSRTILASLKLQY